MDDFEETIFCDEICRLCISSKLSIDLYSSPNPDTIPVYAELIMILCQNLNISDKDQLPQGICGECALKLLQFYKFKVQIEKSNSELQNVLVIRMSDDFQSTESISFDENSQDVNSTESKIDFNEKNNFLYLLQKQEVSELNLESADLIKIELDKLNTPMESELIEVLEDKMVKSDDNIFAKTSFEELSMGKSEIDDKSDFEYYELENEEHIIIEELEDQKYNSGEMITDDVNCVNQEQDKWHQKVDSWVKKQKTKILKNIEKRFICLVCNSAFKHKCELDRHNLIHSGIKNFECGICGKRFSQKSHLDGHTKSVHLRTKDYICKICQMAFAKKYTLSKHMRIHSDITLYQCEYCPRSFKWQNSFLVHRNSHTGERPYKCYVFGCIKSYSSDPALRKHCKRYHNGDGIKPLKNNVKEINFDLDIIENS